MKYTALAVVVVIALAAFTIGCDGASGDVDRDSYVAQNRALLRTIPAFPRANRGTKTTSSAYQLTELTDATAGYLTSRTDRLPRSTPPSLVLAYYRRKLRPDWRLDRSLPGVVGSYWMNLRNGDAFLYVMVGGGVVDLEIDHDCFKGGPSCGGP